MEASEAELLGLVLRLNRVGTIEQLVILLEFLFNKIVP